MSDAQSQIKLKVKKKNNVSMERSDLKILRQGEFARSGLNVADEIEVFEGSENPIQLAQSLTKEFKCSYELVFFPFDTYTQSYAFTLLRIV